MPRKMSQMQQRNYEKVQENRRRYSFEKRATEHTREMFERPAYQMKHAKEKHISQKPVRLA